MRLLPSLLAAVLRGEDDAGFGKLVKNISYKFEKSQIEHFGDLSYDDFVQVYRGCFILKILTLTVEVLKGDLKSKLDKMKNTSQK